MDYSYNKGAIGAFCRLGEPGRLPVLGTMEAHVWTAEEQARLRELRLDPVRNPPQRLVALVQHFRAGGGVHRVTEAGTGPVSVSKVLARKVRDLTRQGKLEWVLGREADADADAPAWPGPCASGDSGETDVEEHAEELLSFAQRLRDRVTVPAPGPWVGSDGGAGPWAMWEGAADLSPERSIPDAREERVEAQWGIGPYDARSHPLFPALKQHLPGHRSWEALGELERRARVFRAATDHAFGQIDQVIKERLPGAAPTDIDALARSLLLHAHYRATTPGGGLEFSYEPQAKAEGGRIRWSLRLGQWSVGDKEEPRDLEPLRDLHRELAAAVPRWDAMSAMATAYRACQDAVRAFKEALGPDMALRRSLRSTRCDVCR